MPNELYLSPNPPDEEHWLCEDSRSPTANALDVVCRPGYRTSTTVYDNHANLDPTTSRDLKPTIRLPCAASPIHRGPPRFVGPSGRRSYKGYFARGRHLRAEGAAGLTAPQSCSIPALALYESWDFGHSSPA